MGPSAESDVSAASSVLVALSLMTIRSIIFARVTGTGYDSGDSACLAFPLHTFTNAYHYFAGLILECTGISSYDLVAMLIVSLC